jgi:hypothetical protein
MILNIKTLISLGTFLSLDVFCMIFNIKNMIYSNS